MVNVASYQHGVGHGPWRRVDGFSEKILDWIIAAETAASGNGDGAKKGGIKRLLARLRRPGPR